MGGSILPVTIHNNKLYFLFGKERDIDENPGWSDFGGGTDNGESFLQTASREGSEELTGFLGDKHDIRRLLEKYGTYNVDFQSQGHTTYRCHIFPFFEEYFTSLPHFYNNNQRFLQNQLDPNVIRDTKIFEKTQIKWFSFDDMKKEKNEFRSFYQNIVGLILSQQLDIDLFIRKSLQKKRNDKIKSKKTLLKRNKLTNMRKTRKSRNYK
jgi:8-oxo-dGTP pyrophosphatase MutT (NUDIX family)